MAEDLSMLMEDLESNPAPPPTGDALSQLQELGRRVLKIDEQLAELESRIAKRKVVRNDILSRDMPQLMTQHSTDLVGVNGKQFALEDYYHASIKKDSETKDQAFDWLETHDESGIIKYSVTVLFPKDSQEQAEALRDYVTQRYQQAEVEVDRGVPWARLTSWLREMYERKRGDEPDLELPPLDVFGATVGQMVKIKEPRKR